jgi:transaldolase
MNATGEGYFHRVARQTATEFWINNPTLKEAELALGAGAVGATTNPTYLSRLVREEPEYVAGLIDAALQLTNDMDRAADLVYQQAVARLQRLFEPLYTTTEKRFGYVAIQGDPRLNTDSQAILEGAFRYRQLGGNIIVKVPSWPAGAVALEKLAGMGIPTIATLGFSVDQAAYMAEACQRGIEASGIRAPCYVTFIAGVLDDYLTRVMTPAGGIAPIDLIQHAGCTATRAAYRLYKDRGYEARLIGGGARGPHHFTELVGGDMAVTIGWTIAQQILESGGQVKSRIGARTPRSIVAGLEARFPDFCKAFEVRSLRPEEFHDFGPVAWFQESFINGTNVLLRAIDARMAATATNGAE